jgi:two-component system, OmpR family, sensor histidine kinase BaeS
MNLSLTHKLFGLLAITAMTAIAATTGVFIVQLERGFVAYMNELDSDYVQKLVDHVAGHYVRRGSLDDFHKSGWKVAHEAAFGPFADDSKPGATGSDPHTQKSQYRGPRRGEGVPGERPGEARLDAKPPREADLAVRGPGYEKPEATKKAAKLHDSATPDPVMRGRPRMSDPFNIAPRTQLLNADGELVGGRPPSKEAVLRRFPVKVNGTLIAQVQLAGRGHTISGREAEHLRSVRYGLLAVAGGLTVVALALAYWVASRWARRLEAVVVVTGKVAQGDFSARANATGHDEIAALARDVNDMAKSLERLESTRRKWLADVAHELRTPLATLQGEIEGLLDGVFTVDAAALKSLHEEVRHLTRLTGDLHQLALSDLGALPIYPDDTDLGTVVDRAVTRWQAAAHRQGLTLSRAGSGEIFAKVDETRITQVIDNLLQNSMRYTDPGGQVCVAVSETVDRVIVTVDDSPPGVVPEDLERMFDPLFRSDAARTRERGGSGIGLALARAIVDAHRGTIRATLSALGGIHVEVVLPRLPAQ